MKITVDRAVLEQALEALDSLARYADTCELFLKETHPGKAAALRKRVTTSIIVITTLRQALEAGQEERRNQCGETCERAKLCATCARGIEAEQQEPVAWMDVDHGGIHCGLTFYNSGTGRDVPLYLAPQRTWVGLTDEEREQHRNDWHSNIHDKEFRSIEAKLKEKNNG